ncbi:oligoendopeptidase, pepF/M3 family [Ancylobacter novellus DSM 506]|uniref:Oligoendopeptidase, pepF/M3 family n=1 Tax=Ancylobacter novellus (strain ATCC 8093 / DSM 506 / JCM 20403 / CCM 1077 / IAM 12100 / NBRC 12443 / NCIMB 10456) TaxID=639283 RepID=D7A5A1_ANCN5|nr:M3 family oligoendopeptidase [Ancylobacter novellus]ADH89989.1 oligoendopeptidase, pepF/M3 family [Ancylobacter novellus DSM 506]
MLRRLDRPVFSPGTPDATAFALDNLPQWDLSDLYPAIDSPELQADLAEVASDCATFEEAYKGKLAGILDAADAGSQMALIVSRYEKIEDRLGRLYSYAGLVYSGDTTDPVRAKFYGDVQEKLTDASTHLLFFTLELNRLDDAKMEAALAAPEFGKYRPWIDDVRAEKPYQLEDRIEQLFHEKGVTSRSAWNRLFDETIAGLRFDIDGQNLPLEQALNLLQEPQEEKRRAAAEALAKVFGENLRLFTLVTNTLAKDKEISDRWRGFDDIADSRHLANRVEREVVDALVSSVHAAYPRLAHRYYKLKAKWFGKDKLEYWDRNAPLPKVETRTIGWDEARDTVLGAYSTFSPRMADIARTFFDKSWIDAGVRPGKATGAFAHPTVPSAHPYVLLNYLGKPRDVMTLAHELGHGVHQVLAAPNGALMAPTPLTLAETASVFGEMLTFRRLLATAPDARTRKAMLAAKVEDMINTVVRQIAFYTFERRIHTERKNGELTAEQICKIWMEVQAESLGEAIHLGPGYEAYWVYIGHFIHSPFYVYAYAFGDCLVNSLYAVYENASEGFAERYLAMLAAGGTKHHSELLKPFGLDARDPAFWQTGLNLIERMIAELEAMEEA